MKTKASRKPVEMGDGIAEILIDWRSRTPSNRDTDWVFARVHTNGQRPYLPDSFLKGHVRPATAKAGITKDIGWHTFRHSVATVLGNEGEKLKTVQELMRHASSKTTVDLYQQGDTVLKRSAADRMSGALAPQSPTA